MFYKSIIGAAVFACVTSFSANAETILRLAHGAPVSDPLHVMAEQFKAEVEEKSGGELKIQIYGQSQLGNDQQMIDGVRSGIVDMEMSGLNNFTGLVPEAAVFTLPFMFKDREAAYAALDGAPGQVIVDKFAELGITSLGFPENGFRNMTNSRGPIKTPEDLKGLRMRVNNSTSLNEMFSVLDANPQQIPVAELYTALETGVVDAQDHPISVLYSFRFYEVQDYLSLTQHAFSAIFWTMNSNKLNGLPPEHQTIIREAAANAVATQRQQAVDLEDETIAALEEEGMQVNRDVDTAAFQEAIKPVWDSYIAEYGDELIKQIQAQ